MNNFIESIQKFLCNFERGVKLKKIAKISILFVFIFSCFLSFLTLYYSYKILDVYKVFVGQKIDFNFFGVSFNKIDKNIPILEDSKKFVENEFFKAKLFNLIPIKTVVVKKYSKVNVFPCGTPFGVKFLTQGVMVVDTREIKTPKGEKNPSKEAGIKKGDIIEYINEKKINSNDDVKNIVAHGGGKEIKIKYSRNFKKYETTLVPVFYSKENKWVTGLWARDSSAGIGTITFCMEDGRFGGLGHAVCDVDTGKKLPLGSGEIVSAKITGIKKGVCESPGELCGEFAKDTVSGYVEKNMDCGLYGKMYKPITLNKPVIIGFKQDAKVGKAQILSTTHGKKPELYDVNIESIDYNSKSRNFVIKIVDNKLLEKTGGILQGMSGSPILQYNPKLGANMLIGAVTHVFLKDSTRGYGVFAETMLEVVDDL